MPTGFDTLLAPLDANKFLGWRLPAVLANALLGFAFGNALMNGFDLATGASGFGFSWFPRKLGEFLAEVSSFLLLDVKRFMLASSLFYNQRNKFTKL